MEAQLSAWLSLDGDSGGDFPLYSSAPHDLPHEQLGHQLSLSQAAVEIPPGHGEAAKCIPKMQRQQGPAAHGAVGGTAVP